MLQKTAIYTISISLLIIIGVIWAVDNLNLLPVVASSNAPIYDELFKVLFIIGIILFAPASSWLIVKFKVAKDLTG